MTWWLWIIGYLCAAVATILTVVKCDKDKDAPFAVKAGIFWPAFVCLWALCFVAELARGE